MIKDIDRYNDLKLVLTNGRSAGTLTSEREQELIDELEHLWSKIVKDMDRR
jgi:hypothetical protein